MLLHTIIPSYRGLFHKLHFSGRAFWRNTLKLPVYRQQQKKMWRVVPRNWKKDEDEQPISNVEPTWTPHVRWRGAEGEEQDDKVQEQEPRSIKLYYLNMHFVHYLWFASFNFHNFWKTACSPKFRKAQEGILRKHNLIIQKQKRESCVDGAVRGRRRRSCERRKKNKKHKCIKER